MTRSRGITRLLVVGATALAGLAVSPSPSHAWQPVEYCHDLGNSYVPSSTWYLLSDDEWHYCGPRGWYPPLGAVN